MNHTDKWIRSLSACCAVLSGILSVAVMYIPLIASRFKDALIRFLYLLMGREIPQTVVWEPLAWAVVFAVPAMLCILLLWFSLRNSKAAIYTPPAVGIGFTLLSLFSLQTNPDGTTNGILVFVPPAAMALCGGGIWLYHLLQKVLPAVFNRETVSYIVFGVLTTAVSFVSQMLFASLGTAAWINTIGSWVCAVAFAYVVNKQFVFQSHTDSSKAFLRELWLFVAARLASLGMELVFMIITVDLLRFSEAICKLIAQVFILVANYVFSKLVIFKKNG